MPNGWAWCRMETICPYGSCEKVDAKFINNNEWILELEDIEKDSGIILSYVSKSQRNSISVKHRFDKGQLLYSKLRPYLNKVVIAPKAGYNQSFLSLILLYSDYQLELCHKIHIAPRQLHHSRILEMGIH